MYYHHAALDPPYVYDAKSPCNYHSWHDTVKHFDLCARFNPSNATDAAASDTSAAARDSGIDTIPVRGNEEEALGPGESREHTLVNRLLTIFAYVDPRHANKHACTHNDSYGTCKPLPAVCLKNFIAVQWPSPLTQGHCVETTSRCSLNGVGSQTAPFHTTFNRPIGALALIMRC